MDQSLSDIGIISAYRFADDGSATKLDITNLDAELADPRGWLWLHFSLANRRCHDWLATRAPLSDIARETLLDPDEHIRLDIFGDEIAGVLPDLHQEFMQEGDDLMRVHFAISPRLMITTRRRPLRAIELTRRAIDLGRRFPTPISLFDAIADQFADVIGRYSAGLGDELDIVENHVLHDEVDDERMRLGRVRLQAIRTRRQLSQIRALFHRVEMREDVESEALVTAMRKLAQKFDALDYEFGAIYERARLLQDEIAGRMTAITNRRLFTLSILTACLLPSTLVTGFFGMNTKDMPFQTGDGGTWYALMLVIAAGGLTWWLLRRTKAL
ncbi:CorA family divalent cation transporter [Bradyrhizobium sp. LHD-71]|uniref:CorA family divalent cation transporter n=1 Tax=Bradyrhizobium sp. LHD-71 TaxID=3072141 RepID=UPI00280FE80A|nr:CorA family divalent cation transporter [Bradyrhizobium sp. LHD-71]MDQ8729061.1 CorA family divalent cation transporter [Bradyrhizobium sp. LHD-71]